MAMAQGQQQGPGAGIAQQSVQQLGQALVQFRDATGKLLQLMQQIAPQSVALFQPIVQAGQAIEQEVQKVAQQMQQKQQGSPMGMTQQPQPTPGEGAPPPMMA